MKITLEAVSKKFADKKVIDNFSAELDFERPIALMGKSGAGKTTLARIIAGIEQADSGSVFGVPDKISFVFQEDRLIPWLSAEKNISFVSDDETAKYYLEKVFLTAEKDTPVSELSGGMKRRIALARAFAYKSDLVILDEAFKGLDRKLEKEMLELVSYEAKKRPLILITHDIEQANYLGAKIIYV